MCETEVQQHAYVTQILWDLNENDFLIHDTKKQWSQVGNNIVILVVCSSSTFMGGTVRNVIFLLYYTKKRSLMLL